MEVLFLARKGAVKIVVENFDLSPNVPFSRQLAQTAELVEIHDYPKDSEDASLEKNDFLKIYSDPDVQQAENSQGDLSDPSEDIGWENNNGLHNSVNTSDKAEVRDRNPGSRWIWVSVLSVFLIIMIYFLLRKFFR